MKKFICILLILFCFFQPSIQAVALEDTTPPSISSITIDKKDLSGGDSLNFSVSGDDDLSGLDHIMIEYRLKSNPSRRISIEFDNKTSHNSFSGTYQIPDRLAPGEWEAYAVQIWDRALNLNAYRKINGVNNDFFEIIDFTLHEKLGADTTPPVLKSVRLKQQTITAPGTIEIIAEVIDNQSTTVNVGITYLIRGSQHGFTAHKVSENTYSGTLHVGESAKYQTAKLAYIVLTDDAGNQAWYSYRPEKYPYGEASLKLTTDLDVSFSNGVTDTQPPILTNYYYSSNEVSAPGSMKMFFEASDDVSGIAIISSTFMGFDSNGNVIDHRIVGAQYDYKSKKYVSSCTFDQYLPNATYSVTKVEVVDGAGNTAVYSVSPKAGELALQEKKITLTKAIEGDIATGTMNENYVDSINSAKDHTSITIDCTKNAIVKQEAFSAIKGTNKNLILVNDGIQWVFKGSDITNPVKNIDTSINIYMFDSYGNKMLLNCFSDDINGIVIDFAPNGLLPGKARIKIKADYTFRNYIGEHDLYIYHYLENESGLETIAEKVEMSSSGYYEFYILHNSKYIITKGKAKPAFVVKDSTAQLNNQVDKEDDSNSNSSSELSSSDMDQNSSFPELNQSSATSGDTSDETIESRERNAGIIILIMVGVFVVIVLIVLCLIFRRKIITWFGHFKRR